MSWRACSGSSAGAVGPSRTATTRAERPSAPGSAALRSVVRAGPGGRAGGRGRAQRGERPVEQPGSIGAAARAQPLPRHRVQGGDRGVGDQIRGERVQRAVRTLDVVLVGRDPERAAAAAAELRREPGAREVDALTADVTRQADLRRIAEEVGGRCDRLDVLINNAGRIRIAELHGQLAADAVARRAGRRVDDRDHPRRAGRPAGLTARVRRPVAAGRRQRGGEFVRARDTTKPVERPDVTESRHCRHEVSP
ncbi:SDR family NAD(P)-dependent oxidoreductase [Pseudonocardia nigra]|uniref:SDR family NAD(P)-dependent oxidoreductase n=1 Tax=Pseudonocardia nigra TaxID=1921578 RepID=UPI001FE2B9CC|nr:SDR family NAD(P)-dependent oxidoreductase [Pseudonocardia nigra]